MPVTRESPSAAAVPDVHAPAPGFSERRVVALLVAAFSVAYALIAIFPHWRFETSYDLAIFDQAVWHLSRFEKPASTLRGFSNLFGDHFHPITALWAPLYWIVSAPEMLLGAQAVLFAASLAPVFLFLRARLPYGPALALSVACGLFWGLQRAAASDVHEIAFAPAVIATLIYAMDQRRWPLFWTASLLLVLVKEDLIPILTFAGLYLLATGERLKGAVLTVLSVLTFVAILRLVIPALNETGRYEYTSTFTGILAEPWRIPVALFTPRTKVETALMWLAPFCFLPLRSPLSILLAPLVLARFLSETPTHWGTAYHYSAPLAPILAMSAGDGLARLMRRPAAAGVRRRRVTLFAGACVVLSSLLPGHQYIWRLLSPEHYEIGALERTGYRALEQIPPGAAVVAQSAIAPHVSQRKHIYLLEPGAPDADFVVACAGLSPWPASTAAELEALIADRKRKGYATVFEDAGWILLRRTAPGLNPADIE